jgi:hypothetical protein
MLNLKELSVLYMTIFIFIFSLLRIDTLNRKLLENQWEKV